MDFYQPLGRHSFPTRPATAFQLLLVPFLSPWKLPCLVFIFFIFTDIKWKRVCVSLSRACVHAPEFYSYHQPPSAPTPSPQLRTRLVTLATVASQALKHMAISRLAALKRQWSHVILSLKTKLQAQSLNKTSTDVTPQPRPRVLRGDSPRWGLLCGLVTAASGCEVVGTCVVTQRGEMRNSLI